MSVIYACAVRACSRIRCSASATATVVIRYDDLAVHLIDLVQDPDPGLVDLCSDHASRLTPPIGWTLKDLRVASAVSA
jgi:hypothetical protein